MNHAKGSTAPHAPREREISAVLLDLRRRWRASSLVSNKIHSIEFRSIDASKPPSAAVGRGTILYITQDGVTDHIGRSQIAPYLTDLARQGFRIHVVSAEKAGRDALIAEYQATFDGLGVGWTRVRYRNTPPIIGQAITHFAMQRAALSITRRERVAVVHCRSLPGALIGRAIKRACGAKFIFDFRNFYADGGLVTSRGPRRRVYAWLKRLEGPLVCDADKVVCLTHSAKTLLSQGCLGEDLHAGRRFQVIPCCADFSHFDRARVSAAVVDSARARAATAGAPILLYLGSLGADYLLREMIALFVQLLAIRPGAEFLFLCNNGKEIVEAQCDACGVPRDRIHFLSADRSEIPAFLALADLSVVFIRPDASKAGCSPTKLAELFACGVPVIANAGVGDMDTIIAPARNASVLVRDFSDQSLRAALRDVLAMKDLGDVDIRTNSREFALEEGVARYAAVYNELLCNNPNQ
jgi:glycosyltransferase involved in cell wall biosynthesis